jgi:phage terminase small subunit
MTLTAKQEAFAQAVADGMTQSDAYRSAYNAGKMKPEAIHVNASKLMADAKVALRVASLREALASKSLWSRLDSVQALSDIARDVEARANEKVAAIKELNAMHGYNEPAKLAISGGLTTRIELVPLV